MLFILESLVMRLFPGFRILSVLLISIPFSLSAEESSLDPSSPRYAMTNTIDQLVEIVGENPGEEQRETRHKKMRDVIEPQFDFEEMSRRSLGPRWNDINDKERKEFIELFSELLARTYLGRLDNIEEGMVEISAERVQDIRALVRTHVTYRGETFPIDYRLVQKNAEWKVYDVVIENIGLVANYRNEFAGIIRREQFAGLLQRLRDKVNA